MKRLMIKELAEVFVKNTEKTYVELNRLEVDIMNIEEKHLEGWSSTNYSFYALIPAKFNEMIDTIYNIGFKTILLIQDNKTNEKRKIQIDISELPESFIEYVIGEDGLTIEERNDINNFLDNLKG